MFLDESYIDGYLFTHIFKYFMAKTERVAFIINKELNDADIKYINERQINKFVIQYEKDAIQDFNFLFKIDHIKYLRVINRVPSDILIQLNSLKLLSIFDFYIDPLDLSYFSELEFLDFVYSKNILNLGKLKNLKTLIIFDQYETTKLDHIEDGNHILGEIKDLSSLDTLKIRSKITNLDFLKGTQIERLILDSNQNIVDISGLDHIKNSLLSFHIMVSRRIRNYDVLKKLKKLIYLNLEYCKRLPDIEFIKNMENLKTLKLDSTSIENGDLNSIQNIDNAWVYPIKKHYFCHVNGVPIKLKYDTFFGRYMPILIGDEHIEHWRKIKV